MSTNHHGAGGSYAIDEAGNLNLQHRTKSREEAKVEKSASKPAAPAPNIAAQTESAVLEKSADQKKTSIRSVSE